MEQCFLCGKPAVKRMEIKVGSSSTSIHHHGRHEHDHLDHGTTTHYALKPLCADCIKQKEEEAKLALKVGGLMLGGMGLGMGMVALIGCLAPFLLVAIGGTLFYFYGQP